MKSSKPLRANKSLIDEFCNITGADKSLAASLLEACCNNLEMAVNMHMEGIPGSLPANSTPAATPPAAHNMMGDGEEAVRAPIPQKQEVLVEGPDQIAFTFRGRRRVARSVFDKFRDFEAETKRQEEELMRASDGVEDGEGGGDGGGSSSEAALPAPSTSTATHPTTAAPTAGRSRRKMKTLEDLFRPPIDLIYRGTFQAARDAGVANKHWLMVNIQDSSEFPCQVLNRDVWSNAAVKTIVKEHFIFWQVYQDSEEGQRYMMFYKVSEWPHVAILDPRTGERLVAWHKLDALTFCDLVTEFLIAYPALDGKTSPPKKKQRLVNDPSDSIMEADEASQIEAAIKASLVEKEEDKAVIPKSALNEDRDDSDALETFDSDTEDIDYSLGSKEQKAVNGADKQCRMKLAKSSNKHLENDKLNSVKEEDEEAEEEEDDDDDNDDNDEDDEEDVCASEDEYKSYLGPAIDPKSKLMLRLPDGTRDIISMPSSSKLLALVKYVSGKGYSSKQYELVTNFPRRQLSQMGHDITLKDAGLFPQETVFIQAR